MSFVDANADDPVVRRALEKARLYRGMAWGLFFLGCLPSWINALSSRAPIASLSAASALVMMMSLFWTATHFSSVARFRALEREVESLHRELSASRAASASEISA